MHNEGRVLTLAHDDWGEIFFISVFIEKGSGVSLAELLMRSFSSYGICIRYLFSPMICVFLMLWESKRDEQ